MSNINNSENILDFYEFYNRMGWSLFAIGQNSEGKRFYPKNWTNIVNQYKDVKDLMKDNPNSTMIGIPMEQNNLLVIDCDTDDNGKPLGLNEFVDMVKKENNGMLPLTLIVKSKSGGMHFYFTVDYTDEHTDYRNSVKQLAPHIDIRARGGMIVGPWSKDRLGGKYEIFRLPKDFKIPKLPEWLANKLKIIKKTEATIKFSSGFKSFNIRAERIFKNYIDKFKLAQKGERNSLLNKYAGQTFRLSPHYLSSNEIWSCFTSVAKHLGLTDSEITATLKSAEKYGQSHSRYLY